jgi:hypothetical protein
VSATLSTLGVLLRRFLTAPESPLNLAVFRIAVCGATLATVPWRKLPALAALPAGARSVPAGLDWFVRVFPLDAGLVGAATVVFALALCACLLGACTPVSSAVACAAAFYLMPIPHLFGKVTHSQYLFWFLLLLAVSPCGRALSVDALAQRSPDPLGLVGERTPVLRWAWLIMGGFYFSAGLWKLLTIGTAWFSGENMRNLLLARWAQLRGWTPLFRIDLHPALCQLAALLVVAFELSFLFLVLHRRTRPVALGGGLLFHLATALFMKIDFIALQVCYVCLVDWRRLVPVPFEMRPESPRHHLGAWVGALLFCGNVAACAGNTHSWPFSAGPVYAFRASPFDVSVELEVVQRDGRRVVLSEGELSSLVDRVTLKSRISRAAAGRRGELTSLLALVGRDHPEVQSGQWLRLTKVTRSLDRYPALDVVSREIFYQGPPPP